MGERVAERSVIFWRALAGALAIVALTGATVALATVDSPVQTLGAATDAKALPALVVPIAAGSVETEPGRVAAADWVTITYPEPDPPPVTRKPVKHTWTTICPDGTTFPGIDFFACGTDEFGYAIRGEFVRSPA
jgi:hypothetical protein